ncbi:MAG: cellulase family glycosylhydrolase [Acidobacteriaceae bacterium]|nr:cellulase family glycosylhydrolase [Acidobacteriaceae bacterium]
MRNIESKRARSMKQRIAALFGIASLAVTAAVVAAPPDAVGRWNQESANRWYAKQPWLVGSNYIPSNAINELAMWQASTFDPARIDTELGWAQSLGMNTMRVFLHDLLWQRDKRGFKKRVDRFLEICDKHGIRPILVLFDSCWDPYPKLGPQRAPRAGVHNSGWVQSPGKKALEDPAQYPRLKAYVEGVVGAFAKDERILAWDVWNEPDNTNDSSYGKEEPPNKVELVLNLLPQAFAWARTVNPQQPLTSGVWRGNWSNPAKLSPMEKVQLGNSDITSFHNYEAPESFEMHVKWLEQYGRRIICTEYMARPVNSTFAGILPIAKRYKVGAINWGFVQGDTQTYLPWDSWQHPYVERQPRQWFHDIFYSDGRPYNAEEVALIRKLTGVKE